MIAYIIRYMWDKLLNALQDPFVGTCFALLVALALAGVLVGTALGLAWLFKIDWGIMLAIVVGCIILAAASYLVGSIICEAMQSYRETQ